jgi:hypothetical protein
VADDQCADRVLIVHTSAGCCPEPAAAAALQEEFEGQIPPYPYMRMRTRQTFPWGTDRGLFEVHQHVPARD